MELWLSWSAEFSRLHMYCTLELLHPGPKLQILAFGQILCNLAHCWVKYQQFKLLGKLDQRYANVFQIIEKSLPNNVVKICYVG